MFAANRRFKCGAGVWQRSVENRDETREGQENAAATFSHNGGAVLKAALAARQTAGLSCAARKRRLKICRLLWECRYAAVHESYGSDESRLRRA